MAKVSKLGFCLRWFRSLYIYIILGVKPIRSPRQLNVRVALVSISVGVQRYLPRPYALCKKGNKPAQPRSPTRNA